MNHDVLRIAQHLADLLVQENAALKRLDYPAAAALTPEKEATLASLIKQAGGLTPAPPLVAVGRRLAAVAAENQQLLARAIEVQTRIVRIVARACAPAPAVTRYGGRAGRPLAPRAAGLALSTRA
jgi:hypothetical protein